MNLFHAARAAVVMLVVLALPGCSQAPADGPPTADGTPEEGQLNVVLGRPTAASVAVSVLAAAGDEAFAEYGIVSGSYPGRTGAVRSAAGEPIVIEVSGLPADTRVYYRVRYRLAGETDFRSGGEHSFHTCRAAGAAFSFGVQGDSHPERAGKMFNAGLYALNMENVAAGRPDFYIGLGDDFSIESLVDKDQLTQANVDNVYAGQRAYFAVPGSSAPVFLVNGNHELAAGYLLSNAYPTAYASAPLFAGRARLAYFPLPAPDGFYSGDGEAVPGLGLPRDYYAWEWGDALFVAIDYYWHSPVPISGNEVPGVELPKDPWQVTIGDAQYEWLRRTLTESRARWKFVFAHHALGGGRGGAGMAHSYEWGGYNAKGAAYEFASRRPSWGRPIHRLLDECQVSIFFFGHDHLFAREKVDGVVYQSVPNPADDTYTAFNSDAYAPGAISFPGAGYDPGFGVILANSGFLQVTVSPQKTTVAYVRAVLPGDEFKAGAANGAVAISYDVTRE
jgi:hypothetical protein